MNPSAPSAVTSSLNVATSSSNAAISSLNVGTALHRPNSNSSNDATFPLSRPSTTIPRTSLIGDGLSCNDYLNKIIYQGLVQEADGTVLEDVLFDFKYRRLDVANMFMHRTIQEMCHHQKLDKVIKMLFLAHLSFLRQADNNAVHEVLRMEFGKCNLSEILNVIDRDLGLGNSGVYKKFNDSEVEIILCAGTCKSLETGSLILVQQLVQETFASKNTGFKGSIEEGIVYREILRKLFANHPKYQAINIENAYLPNVLDIIKTNKECDYCFSWSETQILLLIGIKCSLAHDASLASLVAPFIEKQFKEKHGWFNGSVEEQVIYREVLRRGPSDDRLPFIVRKVFPLPSDESGDDIVCHRKNMTEAICIAEKLLTKSLDRTILAGDELSSEEKRKCYKSYAISAFSAITERNDFKNLSVDEAIKLAKTVKDDNVHIKYPLLRVLSRDDTPFDEAYNVAVGFSGKERQEYIIALLLDRKHLSFEEWSKGFEQISNESVKEQVSLKSVYKEKIPIDKVFQYVDASFDRFINTVTKMKRLDDAEVNKRISDHMLAFTAIRNKVSKQDEKDRIIEGITNNLQKYQSLQSAERLLRAVYDEQAKNKTVADIYRAVTSSLYDQLVSKKEEQVKA